MKGVLCIVSVNIISLLLDLFGNWYNKQMCGNTPCCKIIITGVLLCISLTFFPSQSIVNSFCPNTKLHLESGDPDVRWMRKVLEP